MKDEKFAGILYQRLKYGLLIKDRELKEKIAAWLEQHSNEPFLEKVVKLQEFLKSLALPRVSEKDLPLLAACLPVIYQSLDLVPLDFEEVFLTARYFLKDKIVYKKDKYLITVELLKLQRKAILESIPEDIEKIVQYLASHQGEVEDKRFANEFNLSIKDFYRLVDKLEKYKIAKWTLGFKIKLDIYGKLLARLLQDKEE